MGQYQTPPDLLDTIKDLKGRLSTLEAGQPRPYAESLAEVSTSSTGGQDLGGPSVTIQAAAKSLIFIYAQADLHCDGTHTATVSLYESINSVPATQAAVLLSTSSAGYVTLATAPTTAAGVSPFNSGALCFQVATSDTHTYSLRYGSSLGGVASFYQNRKLWAWTIKT